MINFLLQNIAFISAGLVLYAMISDWMYEEELLGAPLWTLDLLLFPCGALRGLYLGLRQ